MNHDEATDFKIDELLNACANATDCINFAADCGDCGIRIPTLSRGGGDIVIAVGALTEARQVELLLRSFFILMTIEGVKSLVWDN